MARIISIDYGTKRVGLAVTDPLQIIATPLDTIHAKDVIAFLEKYCLQEEVESFVLGLPKNLDTSDTHNTAHVLQFKKVLEKKFPTIPIYLVDERYTSKMAMQAMVAGGMKKKDRKIKGNVDKVSAVIILQGFMNQVIK
jgi:putative Holliday junction resolvase